MDLRKGVVALFIAWLLVTATSHGQFVEEGDGEQLTAPGKPAAGEKPDLEKVERLIVEQTNEFRKKHGREKVEVNKSLSQAAEYFAQYMAKTNKYGHTADGNRPADRAKKFGYEYCIVTENIAYQFNSAGFKTKELAQKFVQGWIESPGHRKNMLDPDVTETGVAVAHSEETGYYFAVQMFGRPKSKSYEFRISNKTNTTVQYTVGDRTLPLPPRYIRTHQRCRPTELTFQLPPEGKEKNVTVRPNQGDHFTLVSGPSGEIKVQKQDKN